MAHIWWECPAILRYWGMIQEIIKATTDLTIPLDPLVYVLAKPTGETNSPTKRLISHIPADARCAVAAAWKCQSPTFQTDGHKQNRGSNDDGETLSLPQTDYRKVSEDPGPMARIPNLGECLGNKERN
ncbi:hypothetical protein FKM82_022781 [Ascaphus truei]